MENRAGIFISQPLGYKTFKPKPLPPDPPIFYDSEMIDLLSRADRMLGRLDGVTETLPDPELFVAMYVQKEAVLSSQIEGTQASLVDVFDGDQSREKKEDIGDIVNYVGAMNYGLERLKEFPLSLRLLREIHRVLLFSGRGSKRSPGEFRTSQNWIGAPGCTLNEATFVPPSVPDMNEAMGALELFMHKESNLPPLIKIALIHAQFETIHPFLDGNGRKGRLLITFWLCQQRILSQPLLYISYFFKQNRQEYYDRLMTVRKTGDWEQWVKFFLKGVAETSEEAISTAKEILSLKKVCEDMMVKSNNNNRRLLNLIFESPVIDKQLVADKLDISQPTANRIVDQFCDLGILVDQKPESKRYKKYAFAKYLAILSRGTEIN
ncbi:MAG: Fic family protein [Mobilibacterium timonense]|uniref:Fic family protein n=1 Tax=Mobilibacterium timonense TaxID=1871012 RepID=UPI002352948B|nr:Fic family protein [Mobilibacterium timonense]MBM6991322.1 Fic family protein [Mobilibacterium timonense]